MSEDKAIEITKIMSKKGLGFTTKLVSMFEKMDRRCRQLALSSPGRPMSDYCEKCQEMFKKMLDGELE